MGFLDIGNFRSFIQPVYIGYLMCARVCAGLCGPRVNRAQSPKIVARRVARPSCGTRRVCSSREAPNQGLRTASGRKHHFRCDRRHE